MEILTHFQQQLLKTIGNTSDFVDIFFINQEGIPFDKLLPQARKKHVGMDDYWLAIALQRVRLIKLLPRMVKPLILGEIQGYFLGLASELMAGMDSTPP